MTARGPFRAVLTVGLTVGLLGGPFAALTAAATPVTAQSDIDPTDIDPIGPDDDVLQTPGTLRLIDQSAIVTGNGVYSAVVDVARIGRDRSGGNLELVVNVLDRVANRRDFRLSTNGLNLGTALATLAPRPLGDYERNANGSIIVNLDLNDGTIPFEEGQVRLVTSGVYPVLFELRTDTGVVVDRLITHIIRLPDPGELASIDVAVALPVGVAPAHRADGAIGFGPASRQDLQVIVNSLDRHRNIPVTLDVVPETLDGLLKSADPTDRAIGTSLATPVPGRLLLDGPYIDADPASLAVSGLTDVATTLLDTGSAVLTALTGTPPRDLTWLAPETVTATGIRLRSDRGTREFVLPSTTLVDTGASTPTGPIEVAIGNGTTIDAAIADAQLSAYFSDDDPVLAAEALLAELWLVAASQPVDETAVTTAHAGMVVAAPNGWTPNPAFLTRLLEGLGRTPGLEPVTIDTIFDLDPATDGDGRPIQRDLLPRVQNPWRGDLDLWTRTQERLDALDSMVVDDAGAAIVATLRSRVLPSFSQLLNADDAEMYWLTVGREVNARIDAVVAPPGRSFTLTSREDDIPLQVRNDGTLALEVVVRLTSDKLEFPNGHDKVVVVPPGDVVDVPIDVRVKSSGAFPVEVSVLPPDGGPVLDVSRITIRSTVLSGIGVILTVAALALLGVWWIIDHRRRQRPPTEDAPADLGPIPAPA